ncbi:hypothetical protein ACU4GD_39830 [Cupriavidus basilensis]
MMAASVLPVLLYLLVPNSWQRLALAPAAWACCSRCWSAFRDWNWTRTPVPEVLSGLILGFGVSLPFVLNSERPVRSAPVVAASLVLVLMLAVPVTGVAAPTHRWLEGARDPAGRA